MKKYLALISLLFTAVTAFSQAKHTVTKASVTFQIKNLGVNTAGTFSGFKGELQLDPAHPEVSRIDASIEVKTINTGSQTRDEHLKGDSYFDAEKYPLITMKSVAFKHKSGNSYTGTFNLTIKDKTSPVELPFTYTETANTATFKGTLNIKRSDYGIGGKSLIMSDDVTVFIDVDTTK